jgi:hypothetical protein
MQISLDFLAGQCIGRSENFSYSTLFNDVFHKACPTENMMYALDYRALYEAFCKLNLFQDDLRLLKLHDLCCMHVHLSFLVPLWSRPALCNVLSDSHNGHMFNAHTSAP